MSKTTLKKPRDYINETIDNLAKKSTMDPYSVFHECEMRIAEIDKQDLDLVKVSISTLEAILNDIDEHNCVNLFQELGRSYSEDKLEQLLKERKAELNKALGIFLTGKANIKTTPPARLFVAGKDFGITPLEEVLLPEGDQLLEFECTETGKRYSRKAEISEKYTRIINTTYDPDQKAKDLIKEFSKQIEKQSFSYTPTYYSFYHMLFDCDWDSIVSLEKMLHQGYLLSEDRKKTGTRRFVIKKTKGFSNGYYNVNFWEIVLKELTVETQTGFVGTRSPRKTSKTYADEEAAKKDMVKKIKAKLKTGYEEEK